mmetsp:Transcript_33773/g.84161  ORF Transcript_33773/g.84161 Transcript_33773/m.84161 type:complete len:207 (-) Transcript_33773:651-1271(-)
MPMTAKPSGLVHVCQEPRPTSGRSNGSRTCLPEGACQKSNSRAAVLVCSSAHRPSLPADIPCVGGASQSIVLTTDDEPRQRATRPRSSPRSPTRKTSTARPHATARRPPEGEHATASAGAVPSPARASESTARSAVEAVSTAPVLSPAQSHAPSGWPKQTDEAPEGSCHVRGDLLGARASHRQTRPSQPALANTGWLGCGATASTR